MKTENEGNMVQEVVGGEVVDTSLQSTAQAKLAEYTEQEQIRIKELVNHIPIGDSSAVMLYGANAQSQLSGFSDSMLKRVKQKELGEVGEILGDLMSKLHDVKPKNAVGNNGVFSKIMPWARKKSHGMMAKYQTVSTQVEQIVHQLEESKTDLLEDIKIMDNMYEQNKEYLKGIGLYITAGELKLDEIETKLLPELHELAINSDDSLVQQNLQDMNQFVDRLEKRMHDLRLTRQILVQSGPQIRMIQSTSQTLAEKIQSSVMTSIPLWKNQITIALTLQTQSKSVAAVNAVNDTTNDLLLKNSELLKMNTISTARANERGVVDIDTLKKTQENLIQTIEETMKIQSDGRKERKLAEIEIGKMEQKFKEQMMDIHKATQDAGRTSYEGTRPTVDQKVDYLGM